MLQRRKQKKEGPGTYQDCAVLPYEAALQADREKDDEPHDDDDFADLTDVPCMKCGDSDDTKVAILACEIDTCYNLCHLTCCSPPRKRIPKGKWYCSVACKNTTLNNNGQT